MWAILTCGIVAMILGAIWYGPLFGKLWIEIIGATAHDLEQRKAMQKKAGPLYAIQFVLTLVQVYVFASLLNVVIDSPSADNTPLFYGVAVWLGFFVPVIAGTAMWNNDSRRISWARFLIQSGYQLVCMVVFSIILGYWR